MRGSTILDELSKLSVILFIIAAALIAIGLITAGVLEWKTPAAQVMTAVGASALASLLVQLLYSRVAQEKVVARIAEKSSEAAVDHAKQVLHDHFSRVVPRKTYPGTSRPAENFREDFASSLTRSRTYRHKGDAAGFASFRLTKLANHPAIVNKTEITFCIVDPTAERLVRLLARRKLRAQSGNYSRKDVEEKVAEIRKEVFTTLISLFDLRHLITVGVYFHRESPFFRAEFFDDELFVSYYLGGDYPGTYLFSRDTYVYEAFLLNFGQVIDAAEQHLRFDDNLTEDSFGRFLIDLGCEDGIEALRSEKERVHSALEGEVPFDTEDLF